MDLPQTMQADCPVCKRATCCTVQLEIVIHPDAPTRPNVQQMLRCSCCGEQFALDSSSKSATMPD